MVGPVGDSPQMAESRMLEELLEHPVPSHGVEPIGQVKLESGVRRMSDDVGLSNVNRDFGATRSVAVELEGSEEIRDSVGR